MSGADDDDAKHEGFLGGWSRRKLAAKRRRPAVDEAPAPDIEEQAPPDAIDGDPEAMEPEADADYVAALPPIEDITSHTDIVPFLRRGVPAALKNAAMRRMWLANPAIRDHVDPALDYAWDWNAPGGVPGGGGKLTVEGVSRMVRNLSGDAEPAEIAGHAGAADDAPAQSADTGDAPVAEADAAPEPPEPAPDADRPDREPAQENPSAERRETAGLRVDGQPGPARRHGGALPE